MVSDAVAAPDVLDDFERTRISYDGVAHDVYRAGSGPAVVVLHGAPGITTSLVGLGRRVHDAGFTVVIPSLLGRPVERATRLHVVGQMVRASLSNEFDLRSSYRSSPVTHWLRALAHDQHVACQGAGVGVVGMGLTGAFGLAMLAEPAVIAAVVAAPTLPIAFTRRGRRGMGISEADWQLALHRANAGAAIFAMRLQGDPTSPVERFVELRRRLGDRCVLQEVVPPDVGDGSRPSPDALLLDDGLAGPGSPLSLTRDAAIGFLRTCLLRAPASSPVSPEEVRRFTAWRREMLDRMAQEPAARPAGRHVFVSYASDDVDYVRSLTVWLAANGIVAWFDDDLQTGDRWEDVLRARVDTSLGMIVVMSPPSGRSQWVSTEIMWAQERRKPIFPLLLGGAPLPLLSAVQCCDVTDQAMPPASFAADVRGVAA